MAGVPKSWSRLTGFGLAKLNMNIATGLRSEVFVKTDHAKDFGTGTIDRLSDGGDQVFRDIADMVLNGMQDGQEVSLFVLVFFQYLV